MLRLFFKSYNGTGLYPRRTNVPKFNKRIKNEIRAVLARIRPATWYKNLHIKIFLFSILVSHSNEKDGGE